MIRQLKFNVIFFCLLVILLTSVSAQYRPSSFERYTIDNGLSNNSVNFILQTADGFLWIATKDGLNRYDGQSFKIFKNIPSDSNSLPENYVMSLLESRDGMLWVGTWGGGLCKFNPFHETFNRVDLSATRDDYIQCLFEDSKNNIWYGTTTGGFNKLNPRTLEIQSYYSGNQQTSFLSDNITSITEDDSSMLWISTWDAGLVHFNPATNAIEYYKHNIAEKNSVSNNGIWHIFNEEKKYLWLSTFSGVDRFEIRTKQFVHYQDAKNQFNDALETRIRQILIDSRNRMWIGTYEYQGLFLVEHSQTPQETILRFIKEDDNDQSISTDRIRWIYEDKKKNVWIGTEDGLNKFPFTKSFNQYRRLPLRQSSLGGRVVSSICEGRDSILWVGFGGGGFDRIDLRTQQIIHNKHDNNNTNTINNDDVVSIIEDRSGILWIGTANGGLNSYNPFTKKFKHFYSSTNSPADVALNWVQQILETHSGQLLVATNGGLRIFDRATETFQRFLPHHISPSSELPQNLSVNALYEDHEHNIWIGTWLEGLYCYDQNNNQLRQYLPEKDNPFSISANKITSIYEDSHGFMWIGTHSGGVNKFDRSSGKFVRYSTHNGLPNDVVFGILEDEMGYLWISTMKGLVKFHPHQATFRVYDDYDGIVHNQFNWRAYFKNKKNTMYFGGINGFVSFQPESISVDSVPSIVMFTSFKVFNEEAVLPLPLSEIKTISLPYDQNFFSIQFTALDLAPPQKHQFAYMLEGVDPQWVYSENRRTAFYTNIQPGKYQFFVRASNLDGIWSVPISLSINILPAWWMTWWFKLVAFIVIASITFMVYRYRVNRLIEIERIRFNIASDLHDEIGSNLSSISVDSQTLLQSTTLSATERELSSDISKTAKETVDGMRDIIWFINPKNDETEDILFKMKETAAKLLLTIQWTFTATADIRFDVFDLEVRRNIFLMYKETLTNVVRHSKATMCNVDLTTIGNIVVLSITDNGVGFDVAHIKRNNGLRNIQHRAEKINAHIELTSAAGNGTRMAIYLPQKNM